MRVVRQAFLPLTRNIRYRKSHQRAMPIVSAARWFEATAA
jgi:hypothetical protein